MENRLISGTQNINNDIVKLKEGVPTISVIVTAHDRKEYLIEAVGSAIKQTLQRAYYEIIVIKNFSDHCIDDFLAKNGIHTILTETGPVGGKIKLGVEHAKGDILVFLEDDDLFLESKLQTVLNMFNEYENLAYIHNSFYVIDNEGIQTPDIKYKTLNSSLYFSSKCWNRNAISVVLSHDLFHNMSSVSIKKKILDNNMYQLGRTFNGPDAFMFYIAMESNQHIMFDDRKLTKYRKHMSLTNRDLHFDDFLNWYRFSNNSVIKELSLLEESLGNQLVRSVLRLKILEFKILSCIAGTPCKKSQMVVLARKYLKLIAKFKLPYATLLVIVVAVWFFSKSIAKKIFHLRYRRTQEM